MSDPKSPAAPSDLSKALGPKRRKVMIALAIDPDVRQALREASTRMDRTQTEILEAALRLAIPKEYFKKE